MELNDNIYEVVCDSDCIAHFFKTRSEAIIYLWNRYITENRTVDIQDWTDLCTALEIDDFGIIYEHSFE